MGVCPGGITIASSAQKETICSTSRAAAAAAHHASSARSSSARALSISRLRLNRILLLPFSTGEHSDKHRARGSLDEDEKSNGGLSSVSDRYRKALGRIDERPMVRH